MVINLPSLEERSFSERMELIEEFFIEEVSNVKVPIKVHKDVIRAFCFMIAREILANLKEIYSFYVSRGFLVL